jgi:hypothetical protein
VDSRRRPKFEARPKRLGAQYSAFEPVRPATFINGDGLTMGENIGDLGGILIAYDAYHLSLGGQPAPVIDGLTGDQRVFLGWAQVWRPDGETRSGRRLRFARRSLAPPGDLRLYKPLGGPPSPAQMTPALSVRVSDPFAPRSESPPPGPRPAARRPTSATLMIGAAGSGK